MFLNDVSYFRPHKCTTCAKAFYRPQQLKAHTIRCKNVGSDDDDEIEAKQQHKSQINKFDAYQQN